MLLSPQDTDNLDRSMVRAGKIADQLRLLGREPLPVDPAEAITQAARRAVLGMVMQRAPLYYLALVIDPSLIDMPEWALWCEDYAAQAPGLSELDRSRLRSAAIAFRMVKEVQL